MDVHVRRAITNALRLRGVDVLTAQEDNAAHLPDPALLDRAGALNRALFSQDDDLLKEASRRQQNGVQFAGVIYAHQLGCPIGRCIEDLALLALVEDMDAMRNRVVFLPLQ